VVAVTSDGEMATPHDGELVLNAAAHKHCWKYDILQQQNQTRQLEVVIGVKENTKGWKPECAEEHRIELNYELKRRNGKQVLDSETLSFMSTNKSKDADDFVFKFGAASCARTGSQSSVFSQMKS